MRGVDDDAHAVEREVAREGGLGEDDVAAARVLELLGAADRRARSCAGPRRVASRIRRSISASASSGSLKPSAPKILMPLSAYGLWLALMTMPGVGAHADGEVGDGRRGDRAAQDARARPSSRCPAASAVSSM